MSDPTSLAVSVAASVALSLLASALTPHPKPTLQDLTITSSAYGSPIAIVYGDARVSTQLIWSDGLKHVKPNGKFGKGGITSGKSSAAAKGAYTFKANLAYSVAEGPITDILTIWANGIIIYDKRGYAEDPNTGKLIGTGKYRVRVYNGSETQSVDPLINFYSTETTGAGSAPAYRGLAYIVFEGMVLTDFGNSIPTIHCEVVQNGSPSLPNTIMSTPVSPTVSLGADNVLFDWTTQTMYAIHAHADASGGVTIYDISGIGEVVKQKTWAEMGFDYTTRHMPNSWALTPSGFLIGTCEPNLFFNANLDVFNLNTMQHMAYQDNVPGLYWPYGLWGMQADSSAGQRADFMIGQNAYGDTALWLLNAGNIGTAGGGPATCVTLASPALSSILSDGDNTSSSYVPRVILQEPGDGVSKAYVVMQGNNTSIGIYEIAANVAGAGTFQKIGKIALTDIGITSGGFTLLDAQIDLTDNTLILNVHNYSGSYQNAVFKWSKDSGVIWNRTDIGTADAPTISFGGTNQSVITSGYYGGASYGRGFLIDTSNGLIKWDSNNGIGSGTFFPITTDTKPIAFDGTTNSYIMYDNNTGKFFRLYYDRGTSSNITLDNIVADICYRCGLTAGDIDVTQLTDSIQGYVIGRRTDAMQALQQLGQLFFFDCVETGTILKFVKRGSSPAFNIPQMDLGETRNTRGKATNDSNYWKHTRIQEIELPYEYHVKYFDPVRNFQVGDQYVRRNGYPIATTSGSKSIKIIEAPIILEASQAAQIAQKVMFTDWVNRDQYETTLGWKYLWLDPDDVLTVTMDNGDVYTARTMKITTGANLAMAVHFVAEDNQTYSSSLAGASGDNLIAPGTAINTQTTTMVLLDLPILRDTDNPGDLSSYLYYGCVMLSSGVWPGAEVYKSTDSGSTFLDDGSQTTTLMAGSVLGKLPPSGNPFCIDYLYTVTVFPYRGVSGTLTNATLENVLSHGANALAIGGEIIQFVNATLNADGSYTLSGILRGCRGTESKCNFHLNGETFIYLDPSIISADVYSYELNGAPLAYRAVTFGSFVDVAPVQGITFTAAGLRPYAPCELARTVSGSDLALTWTRRTRYGGGMVDGTGTVPLNEASEAYEVYMLPISYSPTTFDPTNATTYTRKVTEVTSQSYTYTAAQMTADGFTPSTDTLHLVVYQVSSTVGRGSPAFADLHP